MEELANTLAELQAESTQIINEIVEDRLIDESTARIADLSKQLSDEQAVLKSLVDDYEQDALENRIDEVKAQIIDEWDGQKKTLKFPSGVLSFRTTKRLDIIDDVRLMGLLLEKTTIVDVVSKYIKGFKLPEVKKFVDVHNVQTGVAQMVSKTSVSLKTEGVI